MYMGIDVGGTKVLCGVLDQSGIITEQARFPTPQDYAQFLDYLAKCVATFKTREYQAAGVGIPVTTFNRQTGHAMTFGNLSWRDVAVAQDIEQILRCPVVVENDAKLGALSESMLVRDTYQKVLYITISTGIGVGLVENGKIDDAVGDGGGRTMFIEHDGKLVPWESIASGHAIVERFGRKAMDITDPETWRIIAHDLSRGLVELIAFTEPQVIIFGGSVGVYFDRFGQFLAAELKQFETPLVPAPALMRASRPEEAVVYGCYDYAKQAYGPSQAT
jgi:predicted NBD/HSP70 family sugar kinase